MKNKDKSLKFNQILQNPIYLMNINQIFNIQMFKVLNKKNLEVHEHFDCGVVDTRD
jgi:hypothetical protein